MKKHLTIISFVMIFFSFFSLPLFSQDIQMLPSVTVTSTSNVTEKVNKSFENYFKGSKETRWYKMDKTYLVKFIMNDQKNTALFTKNGSIIYHISYGHEKDLPADIRKTVKSEYVDFEIKSAIKVVQGNREIWVINLEDSKKLIIARFENEELEEVGNYEKSE